MRPSKADLKFAGQLKEIKKGFHRRIGKEMCKEHDYDCFDCQTRWAIGILNRWIDTLEWDSSKIGKLNQSK